MISLCSANELWKCGEILTGLAGYKIDDSLV